MNAAESADCNASERRIKDSEFVCFQCGKIRPLKSASITFQDAMLYSRFEKGWKNTTGPWKTCKACARAELARNRKFVEDKLRFNRLRRKIVPLLTRGTNLRAKDIPRSLVELKHAQLKLKKICKRQTT